MAEPDNRERLDQLEERIHALKATQAPAPKTEEHYSQAQQAWRMVVELVAGLLIGFGIGYGLDALFNTLPWFMVIFTMLGFAAGVKTMIATAQEIGAKAVGAQAPDMGSAKNGDEDGRS